LTQLVITPEYDLSQAGKRGKFSSWFYFRVTGLPHSVTITVAIKRLQILWPLVERMLTKVKKNSLVFKPVFRVGDREWTKLASPASVVVAFSNAQLDDEGHIEASFDFTIDFDNRSTQLYFAFSYPYGYSDLHAYIERIEARLWQLDPESVYYHRELLVRSYEGHRIDLITISTPPKSEEKEDIVPDPFIFPEKGESRCKK
jgi:hypothetical protein